MTLGRQFLLPSYHALRRAHTFTIFQYRLLRELGKRFEPKDHLAFERVISGYARETKHRDICVYAHFDRDDLVDPHVLFSLSALREAGYEVIFVSNTESLQEESISALLPLCSEIVLRENRGYDFGAWKTGISRIENLHEIETLLLANDSVYGPFTPLRPLLSKMKNKNFDFWGITASNDFRPHLQSYFLSFESSVLRSNAFRSFWDNYPLYDHKLCVIWAGEQGLSRRLLRAGFVLGELCASENLRQHDPETFEAAYRADPTGYVNPSRHLWKSMIRNCGCPFLKVEIVRDGLVKVDGLDGWRSAITAVSDYDTKLIQRHVDRMNAHSG